MIRASRHITVNRTSNVFGLTRSLLLAVRTRMRAAPNASSGRTLPTWCGRGIRFVETDV